MSPKKSVDMPVKKPTGMSEPAERDRRIEHRAADIGREAGFAGAALRGQHVDQRFAAADDHFDFSPWEDQPCG